MKRESRCILFDWGETLMRVFPEFEGPMVTWPRVEAVSGVNETLSGLRREWTLALATNADDSQQRDVWLALERVGLESLIDRVYCSRVIGHRKPSPEYFACILRELGMDRENVVMVGDDYVEDVLGANRSGIRAIWFNERSNEERVSEAHRTIHELKELPGELKLLLR
jgi:putative hydrolase of the HAD superfamily